MGDIAGWITTVATVGAAIATALTAWFLAKDRRERQEASLPLLFHHGVSREAEPTVLILAINPGEQRWIIESINAETPGYEIALLRETAKADAYGRAIYEVGTQGRRASIGAAVAPAARTSHPRQPVARLKIYPPQGVPRPLLLSAKVYSSPRRRRSRRQTATISITD